jgi:hypothetical protein
MSDEQPGLQAQVEISSGVILAVGHFPSGSPDPATVSIEEISPDAWAAVAHQPGQKVLNQDGTITVQAPPPPPPSFSSAEDVERLQLVNERSQADPAFAALADLALRSNQG